VAYAIGVAKPMGVYVHTFGTGAVDDEKLAAYVIEHFDMRPRALIEELDLLRPIYRPTAAYGHFGRSEFSWEKTDRAAALASDLLGVKLKGAKSTNGKSNGVEANGSAPKGKKAPKTRSAGARSN
jgi:S-adenosylmethionine synthetase